MLTDERWTEIARYTVRKGKLPGYAVLIEYFVRTYEYQYTKRLDGTVDYTEKSIATQIRYRVMAVNKNDFSDWPIQYDDGTIAYDFPERYPKYVKECVRKCFVMKAKLSGELAHDLPTD